MPKFSSALLLFVLIGINSFGQQSKKIDSLQKLLAHPSLSKQMEALNSLAINYAKTDSAQAFGYANKAKAIAIKIRNIQGLATAYRTMGIAQSFKYHEKEALYYLNLAKENYQSINKMDDVGLVFCDIGILYKLFKDHTAALSYFQKAETIHSAGKFENSLIADYNQIGSCYNDMGKNNKAMEAYLKGLKMAEKLGVEEKNQQLISNLGNIMQAEKNYNEAIKYYSRALSIFKKQGDQLNIGITTLNLANNYAAMGNYKVSTETLYDALNAFTKANFTRGIQICYNNLGALLLRQGKYKEAIPLLNQSLEITKSSPNKAGQALVEQNIGFAYTKIGDLAQAEKWFDKSEESAKKYKADINTYAEIYSHRASLDSAKGDYYNALIRKSLHTKIKDSLLNEKLNRQVIELQTQYETQKKQSQIEVLTNQNTIQFLQLKNKNLALNSSRLQNERNQLALKNKDLDLGRKNFALRQKELKSKNDAQQINLLNKQATIQQLKIDQRNQTIGLLAGSFLLIGIIGYQYFNKRKLQQQTQMQEKLAQQQDQATRAVIEAEENERRRIASDLHDGVGQLLSVVSMNLSVLGDKIKFEDGEENNKTYQQTLNLLRDGYAEMRSISHQMMPNALLKHGLPDAIRLFLQEINPQLLRTNFQSTGFNQRLDSNIEIMLYRVVQECVNNTIKHASAENLDIQLELFNNKLSCTIEDDGKGFDLNKVNDGIGIQNIKSRISFVKGDLDISSAPGNGTLVAINIPC